MNPGSRNNMLAGAFLIVSLLLAIVVSVVLSGAGDRLRYSDRYTVRFSLADGAAGLKPGAEVLLGGQPIGRVESVAFAVDQSSGASIGVDVRVQVLGDTVLFEDAIITLERPLLGNVSSINIPDPGRQVQAPIKPGSIVRGSVAPPAMLAQAGFGPTQSEILKQIIERAGEIVERVDRMSLDMEAQLDPAMTDARAALADVREMTQQWKDQSGPWRESIDRTLANAEAASDALPDMAEQGRLVLDDATAMVDDARSMVHDARPKVESILSSVDAAAGRFEDETMGLVTETLLSVNQGAGEFEHLATRMSDLVAEQSPSLRRMLANARLASDQLKLATTEIRGEPWRLLYRPSTKELDTQLLYDAARTYASAVSDLRAASESLEAVTGGDGSRLAADGQTVAEINQRVKEAFERYEQAERDLLAKISEGR